MRTWTAMVLMALVAVGLIFGCAAGGGSTDPIEVVKTDSGKVSFSKTVHPILMDHCIRCHGEDADGQLSILSYEGVMKGGKSGSFVGGGQPGREPPRAVGGEDEGALHAAADLPGAHRGPDPGHPASG